MLSIDETLSMSYMVYMGLFKTPRELSSPVCVTQVDASPGSSTEAIPLQCVFSIEGVLLPARAPTDDRARYVAIVDARAVV